MEKKTLKTNLLLASIIAAPTTFSAPQIALADAGNEVVVSTTRRPTKLSNVGSSISVLSDVEIEKSQFNFALDALPG